MDLRKRCEAGRIRYMIQRGGWATSLVVRRVEGSYLHLDWLSARCGKDADPEAAIERALRPRRARPRCADGTIEGIRRGALDPSVPATVRAALAGGFSGHDVISLQASCASEPTWPEEAEPDREDESPWDEDDFLKEDWPKQGVTADGSGALGAR